MHILQETPVGYALFKTMPIELEEVVRYADTSDAVKSMEDASKGTLSSRILSILVDRNVKTLGLANSKLADVIEGAYKEKESSVRLVVGEEVDECIKEIHSRLPELLNVTEKELSRCSLLLAHALCREKLKMTPQKNDMVIVQSIKVIDRLDKDINNKCMRIREWYGMHFPEVGELLEDNHKYLEVLQKHLGKEKDEFANDGSISDEIKACLEKTIGGEITEEDQALIRESVETVLDMFAARDKLHDHLHSRMESVAPNMLELLGALLGARIISHAGSLTELARQPASTVQMMGAEKALFKAMKEKKNTPKYGIIYNSTYVGQAPIEIKGQIARTLASKIAIASRCDASGEEEKGDYGVRAREEVERRIAALTQRKKKQQAAAPQAGKFAMKRPSAGQHSFKKQKFAR
ncbi:hypothetical protein NERG_00513 [Nematocida ausubeli]|uniref:Nop domain-containing protein n=1 Tax=Nematocida ausubeli (strain ATCC PRA-371 / ERTm2) TaxID=1913371 RepID=H8ZA92_NEMA1|nr:hypothetical protein NERG_00513 [Nematocida ausubeli]KAI5132243.1 nucleolar protein 58 [Nematocida ausubeli]